MGSTEIYYETGECGGFCRLSHRHCAHKAYFFRNMLMRILVVRILTLRMPFLEQVTGIVRTNETADTVG
jgi:hypothetical protein